jgi:hypothetical protein
MLAIPQLAPALAGGVLEPVGCPDRGIAAWRSAAFDRYDTLHQVRPLIRDEKSDGSGLGVRDDDRLTDPIEQRSARCLCHGLRPDPIRLHCTCEA